MAEWSKALAWKVSIRQNRIEGSNPSRSANCLFLGVPHKPVLARKSLKIRGFLFRCIQAAKAETVELRQGPKMARRLQSIVALRLRGHLTQSMGFLVGLVFATEPTE